MLKVRKCVKKKILRWIIWRLVGLETIWFHAIYLCFYIPATVLLFTASSMAGLQKYFPIK
jgi:hypothetical protein